MKTPIAIETNNERRRKKLTHAHRSREYTDKLNVNRKNTSQHKNTYSYK